MGRLALLGAAALAMAGCTTTPAPLCPALIPYTDLEQQVAAAELPNDGPQTQQMMEDYRRMRDEDRTCLRAQGS